MAYKVFQNGYQLPASDLNNYLMNQSVMVFADSTARSAAITSPVEGMLSYLESTNSYEGYNGSAWTDINDNTGAIAKSLLTTAGDTIYATGSATPARLGIGATGALLKSTGTAPAWLANGTSGQVLTSSGSDISWVTPSGGGGMQLLSTTTLSGTTTTISSISQSYKNLYVQIEKVNPNSGTLFFANIGAGGNVYGNDFQSNNTTNTNRQNQTALQLSGNAQSLMNSNTDNFFSFTVENYASTTAYKLYSFIGTFYTAGDVNIAVQGTGGVRSASAITSLSFNINGNTFNGGTVRVYGVN